MSPETVYSKVMTATISNSCGASALEVCGFVADYGEWLFSSGATCARIEKNITRIAGAFGVEVEMSILPHHLHLTVNCGGANIFTTVRTIHAHPASFAMNTELSRLSWDIADGKVGFTQARARFDSIISSDASMPVWMSVLLVSAANASFCRLFGGDAWAMLAVFLATGAGYVTKQMMLERGADMRVIVLVCSFISAVLAAGDGLFGLGATPGIAVGTSVLYLVPGIPYINSFCDILDRHYICALGRLMDAVVLTACLSAGLCAGMMLMNINMF